MTEQGMFILSDDFCQTFHENGCFLHNNTQRESIVKRRIIKKVYKYYV